MKSSKNNFLNLLVERVNLRIALVSISLVIIGLVLMFVSAWISQEHSIVASFLSTIGAAVAVGGLITVIWDLVGKRAFSEELIEISTIARELNASAIIQVLPYFQSSDIDWDELFHRARRIDLFFMGSSAWRTTHFSKLESFSQRGENQIRIVLPDYTDDRILRETAYRRNETPEKVKERITTAEKQLAELGNNGCKAEIHFADVAPTFSVFRFDDKAVVALYTHRRKLTRVPTFICKKGGLLYEYVMEEIEHFCQEEN